MATESYLNINRKLQATGRAYFEGLSSADFLGLTDEERETVARELQLRAENGDGVSLAALKYVLTEQELTSFAKNTLSKHHGMDLLSAQLVTILASTTKSENVWSQLLFILANATPAGKMWILSHVETDGIPAKAMDSFKSAIAELIAGENNPVHRLIAAGALLDAVGKQPRSAEYVRLAAELQSDLRAKRIEALSDLGFEVIRPRQE